MLALLAALIMPAPQGEPHVQCAFTIARAAEPPQITGAPEVVSRTSVMHQPDSPLAIVAVDLSGMQLAAAPGTYIRSGREAVVVRNVSDRILTDVRVRVFVGFGPDSGGGHGSQVEQPLRPGEQVRLEWSSNGQGNHPSASDDVVVVASVQEVTTEGCVYRPSQSWPTPGMRAPRRNEVATGGSFKISDATERTWWAAWGSNPGPSD
jgi:hypothetical protein